MSTTSKPKVLQASAFPAAVQAEFSSTFDGHPLWEEPDRAAFLAAHGHEFTAVATGSLTGVSAELMAALPALEVVAFYGAGYDGIDVVAAEKRGISVSNTPDVLTDCVADVAFGLLIDVARKLSAADRFVRHGHWNKGRYPLTTRVAGKRLGILGLGRIGKAIAQRSAGFGMEVRYHSRRPAPDVSWQHEASLVELARWTDFLVVASSGGASTHHLVNAEVLSALGPEGFIVNIARGSVIDEQALVSALVDKRIAGAGLDVFEHEPAVPEPLLHMDNVVLLPHLGSSSRETQLDMGRLMIRNLRSWFDAGKLLTPVC